MTERNFNLLKDYIFMSDLHNDRDIDALYRYAWSESSHDLHDAAHECDTKEDFIFAWRAAEIELRKNYFWYDIDQRIREKDIQIIPIEEYPDPDGEAIEIDEFKWSADQEGNLTYRYFYVPSLDVVWCYADF